MLAGGNVGRGSPGKAAELRGLMGQTPTHGVLQKIHELYTILRYTPISLKLTKMGAICQLKKKNHKT